MTPDFRKGIDSMKDDAPKNKGSFTPFARNIFWREDKEEKFILFLTPAEDITNVQLHEWIKVGVRDNGKPNYESFLSRKDPALGEDYDEIEDRLGQPARDRHIAVAVELEPTFTMVNNRKRPTGFEVKTETYERRTDDGTEEVVSPVVGLIIQSKYNFFGWVGSFSETDAPIEETPLKVLRRGKDANTQYDFTPYIDQKVDLTNLLQYLDGISYLRDDMDEIDLEGSEEDIALAVGQSMLMKRLTELADKERYETLVAPVEELENRWGKNPTPKAKEGTATTNGRDATVAKAAGRQDKFASLRERTAANAAKKAEEAKQG